MADTVIERYMMVSFAFLRDCGLHRFVEARRVSAVPAELQALVLRVPARRRSSSNVTSFSELPLTLDS